MFSSHLHDLTLLYVIFFSSCALREASVLQEQLVRDTATGVLDELEGDGIYFIICLL